MDHFEATSRSLPRYGALTGRGNEAFATPLWAPGSGYRYATTQRPNYREAATQTPSEEAGESWDAPIPERGALLRLPQEIRDTIYAQLFLSTRFRMVGKYTEACDHPPPAPNALALLRTCRQVNREIGQTWLEKVLFCFDRPLELIERLEMIPPATVSMIRRVRVAEGDWVYNSPFKTCYWTTTNSVNLLPTLNLDRLAVYCTRVGNVRFKALNHLIKYGNGWKEICYLCDAGDPIFDGVYFRDEPCPLRPGIWLSWLEARDGPGSRATVAIYRGTEHPYYLKNPATWAEDTKHPARNWKDPFTHGTLIDKFLVVVRRGLGADGSRKDASPPADLDVTREYPWITWEKDEGKAEPGVSVYTLPRP